jgi:hypothetical protein
MYNYLEGELGLVSLFVVGWPFLAGGSIGGLVSAIVHNTAWTKELLISSVWHQTWVARWEAIDDRKLGTDAAVDRLSTKRLLELYPPEPTPDPNWKVRLGAVSLCTFAGFALGLLPYAVWTNLLPETVRPGMIAMLLSAALSYLAITELMRAKIANGWPI